MKNHKNKTSGKRNADSLKRSNLTGRFGMTNASPAIPPQYPKNYMRGRPAPLSPASSLLEKEELIQSVSALARLELKWRAFVHARQLTPTEGQAILTCILKARGKFPSPILSAFDKLGQTSLNTTDDALSFAQAVVQAAESQLAA